MASKKKVPGKKHTYNELKELPLSTVEEMGQAYNSPFIKARIARVGVGTAFVRELMNLLGFNKQETAALINISPKTLDRHFKIEKQFKGLESDRILELAELYHKGQEVFGDNKKFLNWLESNIIALGNTSPKQWLDTQQGIKAIMAELGRIQHGIFA